MKCAAFTNLRFIDCDFTIVAERGTHPNLFMKKGSTPYNGDVVTVKFDQMQDIDVWTWMRITTVSNLPVTPPEPEYDEEELEYSLSNVDKASENMSNQEADGVLLEQSFHLSEKGSEKESLTSKGSKRSKAEQEAIEAIAELISKGSISSKGSKGLK